MSSRTHIYQIKITLQNSNPPIWRRIQIQGDTSLDKLHDILQVAMGWTNSHLHQFIVDGAYFGPFNPEYPEPPMSDETQFTLREIAKGPGSIFTYEYDFGDSWHHELLIEEIVPAQERKHPVCLAGERACPPEDVGGVWGYEAFLYAIRDPDHPEHEDYIEWIGGEYDPEGFDLEAVNAALRRARHRRYG